MNCHLRQCLVVLLLAALPAALAACSDDDVERSKDAGAPDAQTVDVGPDLTPDQGVHLPADEAPHSDPSEWWYYTGRLTTQSGAVYGFEATVFQVMIYKAPLYVGHVAITDVKGDAFYAGMDTSPNDQRKAVKQGFKLDVGALQMSGGGGQDTVKATIAGGHGLDLSLKAQKPAVLQYGDGVMTIGADAPFYYYSYTRMAASGTITVGGVKETVTGVAWMDHQWGTIGKGYGWDWFSLRLDDDSEVMLFKVRRTGKSGFIGGTYIDKAGKPTELKASDFTTTATGSWTSAATKITYPHGWSVEVKPLALKVDLKPVVADQEFKHNFLGSPIYWEGLCDVTGTRSGSATTGHAYVEITGNWE
jgi:predicted secreted hydrolase